MQTVLVTGAAGYIGSHTIVELLNNGIAVIAIDNLLNSKKEAIKRVEQLSGRAVPFYCVDLCDKKALDSVFLKHKNIDAVIHFAGVKAVCESLVDPIKYYKNNVVATICLLESMQTAGVKNLVYSSTASVYKLDKPALDENSPLGSASPYGITKAMAEKAIIDFSAADPDFKAISLRYFNAAGAHKSGQLGEDPTGYPHNLMPFLTQVAVGTRPLLEIFGDDYDTLDGSCVRDYMHITDLANAHILALNALKTTTGTKIYNLGSNKPVSVLEIVESFERVNKVKINKKIAPRRLGDEPSYYTVSTKAQFELGFKTTKTLDDICRDHYAWQANNPKGY